MRDPLRPFNGLGNHTTTHVRFSSSPGRPDLIKSCVGDHHGTLVSSTSLRSHHIPRGPTEYQEAFALFDKRGTGRVPKESLGELLRSLGQNPTQREVGELGQRVQGGSCEWTEDVGWQGSGRNGLIEFEFGYIFCFSSTARLPLMIWIRMNGLSSSRWERSTSLLRLHLMIPRPSRLQRISSDP